MALPILSDYLNRCTLALYGILFQLLKVTFLQRFNLVKASNLIKKIYVQAKRITFSKQNTMRSCLVCLDVNHCNNPSTEVDNVSRSISPPLLFISSQHIAKTGVTLMPLRDCMLMLVTAFSFYFTTPEKKMFPLNLCQSDEWLFHYM